MSLPSYLKPSLWSYDLSMMDPGKSARVIITQVLPKKIIPIKLDTKDPYGFINKYQALQYKKYLLPQGRYPSKKMDNLFELAITIAHIGLHYQPRTAYYRKSLQSLVYALCSSASFDITNTIIRIVATCNHRFSDEQVTQIMKAMQTNTQIVGAFGLPELKRILSTTYDCRID